MRTSVVLTVASVVGLFIGCSQSPPSDVASSDNSSDAPTTKTLTDADDGFMAVAPKKIYNDPAESVNDFLNAITTGDDKTATSLLSYAAQRETWSNGLALTSEGFPGTRFEITDVESISEIESHVQTTWVDEQQNTYPCVWLLRKEQHGWCIFAMATKFMESAKPVILPFEDHAKLKRLQQAAIQQMRQQQLATSQQQATRIPASQPASGPNGRVQQASRSTDVR